MFFRFLTTGEIRKRSEFFEPFIQGLTNTCKLSVEPMGEESDHVHVTALSDALGVPIRIVYLDRSHCDKDSSSSSINVNHHDFTPAANAVVKPFITGQVIITQSHVMKQLVYLYIFSFTGFIWLIASVFVHCSYLQVPSN
ncbi:hypothetical protein RD792_017829 [Penstemon davidsonii]|uniref:Uncharacterized protein n=1 Tax=Penstemon davidsonii TaxID=160366 RepID=A0ABR0DVP8_9LAMI|nr:hypothetical protein RD792_004502 [Penstemon davidsonii]KAK4493292.1 hypothetical protein RD792_017829 [Penstemon davidsonii]